MSLAMLLANLTPVKAGKGDEAPTGRAQAALPTLVAHGPVRRRRDGGLPRREALEFERGKAGIAVAGRGKVPGRIDTLIAAAKAGELDGLMARVPKPAGAAKACRAA